MIISKLPVPNDTYLVLIITDKNNKSNHMVYFLNKHGNLVEDGVKIVDATIFEVSFIIKHLMKINFTSDITETLPNISSVFNRLDTNQEVRYDDLFYWQLTAEAVEIMRRYCKMESVLNYPNTIECKEEEHIVTEFLEKGNDESVLDLIERAVV